ncbi:hypothetical protein AG4045_002333 [Apium graveolens]|uniref:ABC transporter domain-containing protein n=1 Tax=Apium graveolens TaxID=4045 RepID=A0A6L5B991_APIGR|nr:hypothetical protein AG4045_002333 [Apium graveolens]
MSRSVSRSVSRAAASLGVEDVFGSMRRSSRAADDDEEALRWAALEKLPTYDRLRTTIMKNYNADSRNQDAFHKEVDVRKLGVDDKQQFIDKLFKVAEEDNERFLMKLRDRVDKVGITLPTVEVRYEHLTIEADCFIGDRALPTLPNTVRNIFESALSVFGISLAEKTRLTILKDASGIIKPSRMTLLLGPPSSGKTTLLLALAGKLDSSLKVCSNLQATFVDLIELLTELARREKDAGIFPEAEIDLFMKATSIEGVESSLFTDYTLRILGLDVCRDTIVGDDMIRGISGGQKKRVTTGEMIVGPCKTLFMDEISTGLDSSTTFQIVKCLQQIVHLTEGTLLMSLLQPAPETFDLFDDIILLSEGRIVYHGPRVHIVEFFESCGFKCPERKGTADFLQEVTSRKDQEQYWADKSREYRYISVTEFANRFKRFHVGLRLENEVAVPYDKTRSHDAALVFKKYLVPKMDLLKASFDKEWLLIQRNSFVYIFKTVQIIIVAIIAATVFLRTELNTNTENDGGVYVGALLFAMVINMFNGFAELSMTIQRLPVFYKQRDLLFHPPWTFTLPNFLLRVPISFVETTVWMVVTYYTIGFAPEGSRFFKQFLLIFLIQQMAAGVFRLISGVCRTMIIANTGGALVLLLVFLLGGFILPKNEIPNWWEWGYWVSPLTYGYNALAVNELYAPRWMNKLGSDNTTRLGLAVLKNLDIYQNQNWVWIGAAALFGFAVLLNILFTFSLMYLNREMALQRMSSRGLSRNEDARLEAAAGIFVEQVIELVELDDLKDAIVGLPGVSGLSTEQRKRLTIAVELLLLMKRGGQVIYSGPLGNNSHKVIEYFEVIPGVPKIKEKYNPATWMLEVSSVAAERRLGMDFAEHYRSSALHQRNQALVKELSIPPAGAKDLYFATEYSQPTWGQFKSCLWKQWVSYWRSPDYNLVRYFFTLAAALMVGTIFWKVGTKRNSSTDLSVIIGAMYSAVLFVGINNCSTVQPIVAVERTVFYRERAAGMYSAIPYALSQVFVEIPYVLVQTTYYTLIVYAMVCFEWTAAKFFWFFFVTFFSFLYFTYYGMMTVSITPNQQVAAIFAAAFYSLFNLFSGFFIPKPKIPKWWIWYYYICPVAWTVYGLIVSQYGDVTDTITVPGMSTKPTIKWYVKNHYGYESDFMAPVAVVLVGFTVFFAFLYAYCLKTLNFQTR